MATDGSTPGDMIVEAKQQLEEIIKTKDSKTPGVVYRDIRKVISIIENSVNLEADELKDLKKAVDDVKNLLGGPNTTDKAAHDLYKDLVNELEKAGKKVSGGRRRRPSKKTRKSRKAKRSMRTRKMRRGGNFVAKMKEGAKAAATAVKEKGKALKEKVASQFRPDNDPYTATGNFEEDTGVYDDE